jgi:hypothetical protein
MDLRTEIPTEEQKMENVRAEYNAICEKLKTLPSFRFTMIGLYVAAVGVILFPEKPTDINFYGMIALTVILWIIDLRTRGLLFTVRKRGIAIEKCCYWGYNGEKENEPYLHHMESKENEPAEVTFFFFKNCGFPAFFSHSLGIDLLFLTAIGCSVVQLCRVRELLLCR